MTDKRIVLSTASSEDEARKIALHLVEQQLAACVNIVSQVESIYRWKEKIESGNETLVFFKVSEVRQSAFQDKLRSLHPYDVPEIIFVSIASGLTDYLQWVSESCRQSR